MKAFNFHSWHFHYVILIFKAYLYIILFSINTIFKKFLIFIFFDIFYKILLFKIFISFIKII